MANQSNNSNEKINTNQAQKTTEAPKFDPLKIDSQKPDDLKPDDLKPDPQKSEAPKINDLKDDTSKSETLKSNALKSEKSKSFRLFGLAIPKISLSNFKTPKIVFRIGFPKISWLWLSLIVILVSYICMGYFLSVLLTMRSRKTLAIAGFIIFGLFPTITAFADYALMKWGYLISGVLIVGALIFLVPLKFYLLVLAIIVWVGLTAIAFVGDTLSKNKKLWMAIIILTIPCLIGLGIGHQIWRLAAATLS
jgi:hypothetical protein